MKINWFLIVVLASILLLLYSLIAIGRSDDIKGNSFCKRMGYDGVDTLNDGEYSAYHGKIGCSSSFKGEGVNKTFNVVRDNWHARFYLNGEESEEWYSFR